MAAEWGLTHDESLKIADQLYVSGNIFKNEELLTRLPVLATSCVGSAAVLRQKRALYEHDDVFPPAAIDYIARLLEDEDDLRMNEKLVDLPADDRLTETRRIMHKDLHRH